MTHKEAIEAAMRDESFQASCTRYAHGNGSSGSVAHAAITAYLTARDMVLVPRVLPRELYAAAGNALVNGRVKLKAHHDYLIDTVLSAIVAEMDRREKRG